MRLLLFALTFAAGIAVGAESAHPWWQTALVGAGTMLLAGLVIDRLFSDKEGKL